LNCGGIFFYIAQISIEWVISPASVFFHGMKPSAGGAQNFNVCRATAPRFSISSALERIRVTGQVKLTIGIA
jgi:hypothetical protein